MEDTRERSLVDQLLEARDKIFKATRRLPGRITISFEALDSKEGRELVDWIKNNPDSGFKLDQTEVSKGLTLSKWMTSNEPVQLLEDSENGSI